MTKLIDLFLRSQTRISYRRLLCFLTATTLLLADKLVASDWLYVAVAFIAGEAMPKMAEALRGGQAISMRNLPNDMITELYGGMDDIEERVEAMTADLDAGRLESYYPDARGFYPNVDGGEDESADTLDDETP